mmetsp:Transcript_720/g.614  ORF Transcript_720/g.614 Transcript_720/m.614 type:complete len:221 (+) Transcript_720:20-682(+)
MSNHYPSHWWSFAIAGCIFILCVMFIYWRIKRQSKESQSEYTPIDQAKPTELFTDLNTNNEETKNKIKTVPSSRRSSFAFKKLLRLNEDESLEDGFETTSHNKSVISIGGYHAKQTSRYQSFNIGPDEFSNFTQLSTYTPNATHNKDNEHRIATIKEMLSTHHQQQQHTNSKYSSLIGSYSVQTSSSSDNDEDNEDIEDSTDYDDNVQYQLLQQQTRILP